MSKRTKRGIYSTPWNEHLTFVLQALTDLNKGGPLYDGTIRTFSERYRFEVADFESIPRDGADEDSNRVQGSLSMAVTYEDVRCHTKELARFWISPQVLAQRYDGNAAHGMEVFTTSLRDHFKLACDSGLTFKEWTKFYRSCPSHYRDLRTFVLRGHWKHCDAFERLERIRNAMLKKPYTMDTFLVDSAQPAAATLSATAMMSVAEATPNLPSE